MAQENLNIQATFDYEGTKFQYTCPYSQLDRNYDDETYAYFLKDIPNAECGLFEINILKDKETELMVEDGYVAIYSAPEQAAPDTLIDASIAFV
jgi:hypothetical protein